MQNNAKNADEYIAALPDWQAKNIGTFRELVHEICPDVIEEIKWGVPVFVCKSKMVFAVGSFKVHSKYNFLLNGAELSDPHKLFNNGLESKKSRSIDLREGESINTNHLKALMVEAIEKLQVTKR